MAALSYRQVKDLYDQLKASGATSFSLPEWSAKMNEATGTDLYTQGQNDNVLKRASVGIDRALEWTGLPKATEGLGRQAGALVGNPEAGGSIGEGLPRMAVNMLPFLIPGAGWGAAAARLGGAAALAGSEAYTRTGSPASGIVSGALNAALPKVADIAEQAVLRRMGVKAVSGLVGDATLDEAGNIANLTTNATSRLYPETLAQRAAAFGGGQVAAAGLMEGQRWGEEGFSGEPLHNPFSTENLLNYTLGQVPFLGIHALGGLHGGASAKEAHLDAIARTEKLVELKRAQDALGQQSDIEKIAPVTAAWTPEQINELLGRTNDLRQQQEAITSKTALLPEDVEKLNSLTQADAATPRVATATSALGAEQGTEHIGLVGKQIHETAKWRKILVADDPTNPDEFRGKVIEYSKGLREPEPKPIEGTGHSVFGVTSDPLWRTERTVEDEANRQADYATRRASVTGEKGAGTPDLPEQAQPAADYFSHISDLDKIEADVDVAKTPAQMQRALLGLRALQDKAGLPELSDSQFERVRAKLIAKGAVGDDKQVVKQQASRVRRKLDAQEKTKADLTEAEKWLADQHANDDSQAIQFQVFANELTKHSARGADLVTSGRLTKMFYDLKDDPQALERLKTQANEAIKSGKGLAKPALVPEIKKAEEPIRDLGTEAAYEVLNNASARQAFETWPRKSETTFNDDRALFLKWADETGIPAAEDIPDLVDTWSAEQNESPQDVKAQLEDFIERPHVKIWTAAQEARLRENRAKAPQAAPRQISAGGDFVWGLADYDPATNKLAGKHTLPKSSELTEAQFLAMSGRGKPLNRVELDTAKLLVPEAFDEKGNVNVRKLYELLPQRQPVTNVSYGQEGKPSEAKAELDKMTHDWVDTLPLEQRTALSVIRDGRDLSLANAPRLQGLDTTKLERYRELARQVSSEPPDSSPRATHYYNQISPFDTKKFPVVRVDVALPNKKLSRAKASILEGETDPVIRAAVERQLNKTPEAGVLWPPDNLHENLPNTLGWAMVQFVPDPRTGETVAFVGEQQSRWGQERQRFERSYTKEEHEMLARGEATSSIRDQTPSHPLLPIQSSLVLKAVIAEAAKRGVTKVVLSDGESVMITEGHDKAAGWTATAQDENGEVQARANSRNDVLADFKKNAERNGWIVDVEKKVDQEGGMRLHYDTTLPSAMKKLTGEEGNVWEGGVHKNAKDLANVQEEGPQFDMQGNVVEWPTGEVKGSPVFRNPDGTPKSSVTGRIYDISNAQANLAEQGGFTLGDPSRAPRIAEPKRYASEVAAHQEVGAKLTTDGHGLVAELLQDSDPQVVALAKDLQQRFPEALKRIDSGIYDVPGSYAARRPSGRVGIFFDRGILTSLPFVRNNVALHELVHGLTLHELANPRVDPKVIADLTNLRERLVDALPRPLQAAYDQAVATDWYSRYSRGQAEMSELHEDNAKRQILYGLLNNDELVAQSFTSKDMQRYMQGVKSDKVNGWQGFTRWVKSLLGVREQVTGTAFDDFLSTTSQLLTNGEYLSDFANFGERYLEGKGESQSYARGQTDRALGLVANSSYGADEPLTIATSLDLTGSKSGAPLELRRTRRDYDNLLKNSEEDRAHVEGVLAELGHKDIDEMVTSAIGEGSDISSALDLLPPEASAYVYAKLHDAHDVLDVVRAAASEKNKGMVNLANPELLRKSIAPVLKNVKKALAHEEFQTQMATNLAGLSSTTPEGFLDGLPSFAPKKLDPALNAIEEKNSGWFDAFMRQWEPITQLARRVPEIAEFVSKGRQLPSNIRRTTHEALKWFAMDTSNPHVDVLTDESEKQSERIFLQPKLRDAVGQYIYQNQIQGGKAVGVLPETNPAIAKLKAKFTPEQWQDVLDGVNKQSKTVQAFNKRKLGILTQIEVANAAKRLQFTTGLKTKDNLTLAGTLLDGMQKAADPMTQVEGQMLIQSVQQRIADPTAMIDLYDYLKSSVEQLKLQKDYIDANPAWATAQRMEQYTFNVLNKSNKVELLQASTIKEAKDIIAKGGYKLMGEIKDQWAGREDTPWQAQNLPPEMIQRMQQIVENQKAMLAKSGVTAEEFENSNPLTQILREAGAAGAVPSDQTPARLLSKGADKLPWLYNHIAWIQRESSYWNRALLRSQKDLYLRDIEVRDDPDMVQHLNTHFDNILRPDPRIATQANRLVASWFLPYNLAMHIINGFQPYITHVAELMTMNGGKAIDAYSRIRRAHQESIDLKFGDRRWATPEHEWLHNEAVKDGQIGPHKFDDDAAAQETRAYRFMQLLKKEAPKTLGQRLGSMADAYTTVGMWTFKGPEQMNAETALFSSYDLLREQGLSKEDAKQKAYEFNGVTNFNEGRNQRGVGLFSSKAPTLRGAAMLGTGLQSYVLGTTAQIIRYVRSGYFRPAGITPAESFAAKRAAVQMIATQFALAGTLGMPFVSGALALLNSAFPDLEVNKNLREWMNKFMSSDEHNGNVLTDIAMTGIPSMMGWDMQGRLSLGNTLPGVSEVNGFQPENLLGPTANIVHNFITGTTGWARGDASAGFKFLPPSVAKLIQAGQAALSSGQAGGGIRDYAGRPLENPTPGEYAGSFLGFQPKRLSDQNAASRMLKQSEDVLRTQESRFRQAQAEEVLKGNFGTVRQELTTKKREQKDYNDVAAVQSIAQAAEALAFPRDLRREGTKPTAKARGAFLQSWGATGGQGQGASEVQRLQFRKQIEQRLGLVGDSRQEQKLAILMDGLKAQMPEATRLEVKAAALEAMRRSQRRELQEADSF